MPKLMVGPAGSGKTTALCARYADLVRRGEKRILFLVHSRRAARALADRILREVGTSTDQVRVVTWHQYGLSLLRAHHRRLKYTREPALLTGPEQFTLVRELLNDPVERAHWKGFTKQLRLVSFVEELREFVLRAQDALLLPEDLEARAREAGREDLVEAARFFRRYLTRIDDRDDAVVDHANVIARAWQLLTDSEDISTDATHLLVDDLHDVTPAQQRLLRALFTPEGSIVATANPDAAIFGFRGGSEDAVAEFLRRYEPVEQVHLDTNHRGTPKADAWLFDHLTEEADAVARECRRLHARDGVPWGQIAIVVRRYGAASRAIRRALDAHEVPAVVVGENRPLANEPALIPMLECARAALRPDEREERLPKVLCSPVAGLDPYDVRAIRREARIREMTLKDMVAEPPAELPERIATQLRALHALLQEIAELDARARPDAVFWFLWDRLGYFADLVAAEDEDGLDAVAAFARAIERFSDRRAGKCFSDYLAVLEGVEFGPEPWNIPEEHRPDAVRLMTAHTAAGAEFDAVIVAGCVEGEFPDPHERRAVFDVRDLLAPATPFERQADRLAAERRLFSVATSRARTRLLLTAARESSQRAALAPTPFVHLLGLEWRRPEPPAGSWRDALTRDDAESEARKAMRRADLPEQARRDALAMLARLPGVEPSTWWFERGWTDPGIPIAPEELRTSYSRLSKYDNCALEYLYGVELGLDPESSHQMTVGSWVHDIVDKCARGEIDATEEALIAELDRVWDPNIFDGAAIAHRRRIDCEEMLRRWLAKDGSLDTLASEVDFKFPIDGALMRGRIDRLVRCGGKSVRVIDYKTGRNAKSQEQVDEDLQLASYYLALKRDPDLQVHGEPIYLELAYLGAFYKDGFIRRGLDPRKDESYEQEAQARLEGFVAGIRAEEFAPSPGADCQWCKFKPLCPVWPEGDEVTL